MRAFGVALLGMGAALLAGCVSPEEQRATDAGRCAGFGFQPGTDAMANCMMSATRDREAQQAADRRAAGERSRADEQARRDRDAADRARSEAADQRRRDDFQREFNSGGPAMPGISRTNCSSTSSGNAGRLSCN